MVAQLTHNACPEEMRRAGLDPYYVDHGTAVYPQSAAGIPWSAATIQSKGDPITDLYENMAADDTFTKTLPVKQLVHFVYQGLYCFSQSTKRIFWINIKNLLPLC